MRTTDNSTPRHAARHTDAPPPGQPDPSMSSNSITPYVDLIIGEVERQLQTARLPTATYRVQFNNGCSFREVEAAVPYLYTLGISDLYASPFLQARPGSPHGYDVVNHAAINFEVGTLNELRSLRSALREHDMGLLADVVPNHMSTAPQLNAWWTDVLENGPSSAFAAYFDIDWGPLKPDLAHKVLLPVLGAQFGKVLEDGQLTVRYGEGSFWLEYRERRFPIAPRSYSIILLPNMGELRQQLGAEHADLSELLSILTAIKNLPPRTETDAERLVERRREKEVVKRRLHDLLQRSPEIAAYLNRNLVEINGERGHARSFDRLDELLQDQAYRLAYWRVAADEINYRRFFDINELAAICTEHPQVFVETHKLLFELLNEGTITGLRIDHPDGLYDPRGYLMQLQEQHFLRLCREAFGRLAFSADLDGADKPHWPQVAERLRALWWSATEITGSPLGRPLFIVVEKILAPGEALPENWPVHGTVGYEFLNAANRLFVEPRSNRPLSVLYSRFTDRSLDFDELAYQCKRLILRMSMASELNVLGRRLDRISERNRWTRDFTLISLTQALQEVIACYRVYRSYVQPGHVLRSDRQHVTEAIERAKRRNPAMDTSIFDFVCDILLLNFHEHDEDSDRLAVERFVGKFQQLTGPITAKAIEDTAFYRFNLLVSLNEVGGEPTQFSSTPDEFHAFNQSRAARLSHSLLASTTHDTKRSEDVRARINVLSEIPREWREHVQRWSRWNRRLKCKVDGMEAPNRNSEYLLYQTLVGIWPEAIPDGDAAVAFTVRLQEYMLKVIREAKVNTSWVSPHEPYEAAMSRFVSGLLVPPRRQQFLNDLHEFAGKVADHGRWNSLAQLILKITVPGVPDFYQGSELWQLTLVDPDNRRPVDLGGRRELLDHLLGAMAGSLGVCGSDAVLDTWFDASTAVSSPCTSRVHEFLQELLVERRDGRIKLLAALIGLRLRRRCPDLFTVGAYEPLSIVGPRSDHLVAFLRHHKGQTAIVAVPRFSVSLTGFGGAPPVGDVWAETKLLLPERLQGRAFMNVLTRDVLQPPAATGSLLPLSIVFGHLPMCVMTAISGP